MPSIPLHPTPRSPPPPPPTNPLPQLLHTHSGLAIVEVQGTINLPQQLSTTTTSSNAQQSNETPVGRLIFPDGDLTSSEQVYLYIGKNQRLTGEVKKLATPLGVLRRRDNAADCGGGERGWEGEELEIFEIVRWKLLFSQRPEPVS
ncbi:chromosome transmission fidelity protein 8 [Tuber brumale]|nr:chromosome transmission fidelity protein 8 [Tuber brumale]